MLGIGLALNSALFAGAVFITVRKLNASPLHWLFSPFYVSVMGILLPATCQFVAPSLVHYQSYTFADTKYFLGIGLAAYGYQCSLSIAYKFEKASKLSPTMYLTVILGAAADVALFNDTLELGEIIGGLLILCCLMVPWTLRFTGKIA